MNAGRRGGGAGTGGVDPIAAVARGPLRPYYLLFGDDVFLLERGLATLRARLAPGSAASGVRVVWGDDDERLGEALADLGAPSLFGGTTVLVVRRADALSTAREDAVIAMLPGLDDGGRLVLVAKALDQRRRLHAACTKAGAAVGFARVADHRTAATWVATLARERGHAIGAAAVDALLERTGADLARIDDELEKLSLHVGAGTAIEPGHVERLVAATRLHAIEDLTDRLARRDTAGALRALRGLVAAGEPLLRVVAFVASNLRRALHVNELLASGLREDAVAARLGMPPWLVARQAGRGTPAALEDALAALAELDVALKSSRPDEATFEATVLRIAGGRGRTPGSGQAFRA